MSPDCSGNYFEPNVDHPNKSFWEATPSGSLFMCITNKEAAAAFECGAIYTLTFEKDE
ncbi:hypothetical protein GDI3554 [Gluconacetobacter diazotrophicus PA1 5]|uniref:Uncharacterized protein n=2 Tax=Gluconacetobacter diazotrophicus TaxID=33996 RepID=A9H6H7_GLUDA|nr:hypothetical protein GDI3554 [Gluconacetobacter diazotrophicus PA1 5]